MRSARPYGPESMNDDLSARARTIIDANLYMTLATADEVGRPWASPVYFAHADHREFFWVSRPDATHSLNIAARPELGIVVFDSHAPISTGGGMYMSAIAEEVTGDERETGMAVFSARSLVHGGEEWGVDHVEAPSHLRLYRATASEHWVLDERDRRQPVSP
jgi:nitroimidazol reductase NimA-like FMN-containing flavoprotein (pyridoxamine 5'-phosphate oxidase superfamily)